MPEPMETPWSRARKRRSQRQEERLGGMPGGSQQPNSGRIWRFKRDAKLWNFLIEARTNEKAGADTYRISRKEFLDIEKQAFQTPPGLLPGMQLDIQELQLIVIRLTAFQQMMETLMDYEARIEALEAEILKLRAGDASNQMSEVQPNARRDRGRDGSRDDGDSAEGGRQVRRVRAVEVHEE